MALKKEDMAEVSQKLIGKIDPLEDHDSVSDWIDLFESFLSVNQIITDSDRMQYLVLYGGKIIFSKLKIICAPKKPLEASYKDVKNKLVNLLTEKVDSGVAKQKFYNRTQFEGESCQEFAMALKSLSANCEFSTHLDHTLRDHFVFNLRDKKN